MKQLVILLVEFLWIFVPAMHFDHCVAQHPANYHATIDVELRGLLVANNSLTLRAATTGKVHAIPTNIGSKVKLNQTVVILDSTELKQQQRALAVSERFARELERIANSGMKEAEPFELALRRGLQEAEATKNRLEGRILFQRQRATADATVAKLQDGLRQLEAKKLEIEDQRVDAKQALTRIITAKASADELNELATKIKSPVDGVVSRRLIRVGDHVQSGQPLLEVLRTDSMQVVVWLSPSLVRNTDQIRQASILSRKSKIWHRATIGELSPFLDERTKRRPLLLTVTNKQREFVAGTNVQVRLEIEKE